MYFSPDTLAPARRPGENFADYARRRKIGNEAVKRYLRGVYFYELRTEFDINGKPKGVPYRKAKP